MTEVARILSFDIGIKNLAYCFLEQTPNQSPKILDWKVVDLMNTAPPVVHSHICQCLLSSSTKKSPKECGKKAKYQYAALCTPYNTVYICETHAKANKQYLIPKKSHEESALNKLKREGLDQLITEYKIPVATDTKITKKYLVELLRVHYTKWSYRLITAENTTNPMTANQIDMITIGRNIQQIMDSLAILQTHSPTHVIMENQISTMASRMKTIQGELTMYFIMKFPHAHIEYISSANKLKHFAPTNTAAVPTNMVITPTNTVITPTTKLASQKYRQHKQDAVTYTRQILEAQSEMSIWEHMLNSKKKDDLADCFLQGIWYTRFRL